MGNAFDELMKIRNKDIDLNEIEIIKSKPLFKTPFKMGEVTAEICAAKAIAANDIWEMRTGRRQHISIEEKYASALSLQGTGQTRKKDENGNYQPIPPADTFAAMVATTQCWQGKNGRWYLPHFNLPHLKERVLNVLQCDYTPEAVKEAISHWDVDELDAAITDARASGGIVYTQEEWLNHPHGKYLNSLPVVRITKIGDSKPEGFKENCTQPLSGVNVLDLTRILAGPTCGISLVEHGANDLMVTSPKLPQVEAFVRDTSHGKRSCFLDYTIEEEKEKLKELVKDADIFIEGYRPQSMVKHGFGPEDVAKMRPGIIYVTINCYGSEGPYGNRAGWDQCAQAVTGMCVTQGEMAGDGNPVLTPVFVCDFLTGLLGSYGAMLALAKRAKEGGSYHIEVSLCQSAMLLQRQGLRDDYQDAPGELTYEELEPYAVYDNNTVYGDLRTLGPITKMSETNPCWNGTTPKLGSSEPKW